MKQGNVEPTNAQICPASHSYLLDWSTCAPDSNNFKVNFWKKSMKKKKTDKKGKWNMAR
jgi:hypothetical protein